MNEFHKLLDKIITPENKFTKFQIDVRVSIGKKWLYLQVIDPKVTKFKWLTHAHISYGVNSYMTIPKEAPMGVDNNEEDTQG